jgi:hypothetical protein
MLGEPDLRSSHASRCQKLLRVGLYICAEVWYSSTCKANSDGGNIVIKRVGEPGEVMYHGTRVRQQASIEKHGLLASAAIGFSDKSIIHVTSDPEHAWVRGELVWGEFDGSPEDQVIVFAVNVEGLELCQDPTQEEFEYDNETHWVSFADISPDRLSIHDMPHRAGDLDTHLA